MKFVKLEALSYETWPNNFYQYTNGGSIIVNSSHIIDIYKLDNSEKINDIDAKKYSQMFDVPVSELCILKITLIDKRSWTVVAPEKKFNDFK